MAPISFASFHAARDRVNTRKEYGRHAPITGDYPLSSKPTLASECEVALDSRPIALRLTECRPLNSTYTNNLIMGKMIQKRLLKYSEMHELFSTACRLGFSLYEKTPFRVSVQRDLQSIRPVFTTTTRHS